MDGDDDDEEEDKLDFTMQSKVNEGDVDEDEDVEEEEGGEAEEEVQGKKNKKTTKISKTLLEKKTFVDKVLSTATNVIDGSSHDGKVLKVRHSSTKMF